MNPRQTGDMKAYDFSHAFILRMRACAELKTIGNMYYNFYLLALFGDRKINCSYFFFKDTEALCKVFKRSL